MGRTFVIGDIHGAYRALRQCFERASFNMETDRLISLGDVADGWPETSACIDELLKVKNLHYVLGNHDFWTLEWMETGEPDDIWLEQGGQATVDSYNGQPVPAAHVEFLKKAPLYHLHENKLFVHAGIEINVPLEKQTQRTFLWDRGMAQFALELYTRASGGHLTAYDEIYIGHTPIRYPKPIQSAEIWLMDTGAGWSGVLSMMNIETKEVFASDPVPGLYPGLKGRQRL